MGGVEERRGGDEVRWRRRKEGMDRRDARNCVSMLTTPAICRELPCSTFCGGGGGWMKTTN